MRDTGQDLVTALLRLREVDSDSFEVLSRLAKRLAKRLDREDRVRRLRASQY